MLPSHKPSVVHHKKLHAQPGRFFRQGDLLLTLYIEGGGIPGVIQNRQRLIRQPGGHQMTAAETVHPVAHILQASVRIPRIYGRGFKAFPTLQRPGKIRVVDSYNDI